MRLSVIIPALNEEEAIRACLEQLQPLRAHAVEILVVDGGSGDATCELAEPLADGVIAAPRGRALQMNAGARVSKAPVLLFLHADTTLPDAAPDAILEGLEREHAQWGRFDVTIAGANPMLALVAFFMNARSRLTGIATGDQAIFVRRAAFERCGGFAPIPLMEDVALCKKLKRLSKPACLRERVTTSGRRWEKHGTLRTILLMWRLRLAYALGADPERLARRYDLERSA